MARRSIPYFKIGAKVFFDPEQVREKLAKKNTTALLFWLTPFNKGKAATRQTGKSKRE